MTRPLYAIYESAAAHVSARSRKSGGSQRPPPCPLTDLVVLLPTLRSPHVLADAAIDVGRIEDELGAFVSLITETLQVLCRVVLQIDLLDPGRRARLRIVAVRLSTYADLNTVGD